MKRRCSMKRGMGVVVAIALILAGAPALAGGDLLASQVPATFHSLSRLSLAERVALTPLPDAQLAAVEGEGGGSIDFFLFLHDFQTPLFSDGGNSEIRVPKDELFQKPLFSDGGNSEIRVPKDKL
jgi:hypothetical protein